MKMLLRNMPTGFYVESAGGWTSRREGALVFESLGPAVRFAREQGLSKMQLVFVSDRAEPLVGVPVESLGLTNRRASAGVEDDRHQIVL